MTIRPLCGINTVLRIKNHPYIQQIGYKVAACRKRKNRVSLGNTLFLHRLEKH